jgi:hypothetical protein
VAVVPDCSPIVPGQNIAPARFAIALKGRFVKAPILIVKKDILAIVPALGDMMGIPG